MSWSLHHVEIEDYDQTFNRWTSEISLLHIQNKSFASGGMRDAYKAHNCKVQGWDANPMVLKMHQDRKGKDDVKKQVIMQAKCISYAEEYNKSMQIPKKVRFEACRLICFLSGKWEGMYGTIERYIGDNFVKHNTVHPLLDGLALTERNTPQAFSHFTFQMSGKKEIVVDIQGVDDCFTDPQMYSVFTTSTNQVYGDADWGLQGILNFFANHRCNALCEAHNLPSIQIGDLSLGTQPRFPLVSH